MLVPLEHGIFAVVSFCAITDFFVRGGIRYCANTDFLVGGGISY
jgi:hypothetical protein